jgi:hypothetical protein
LGFVFARARFPTAFFLVGACAVTLFVGAFGETKGDDPIPMSPWNHIHVWAVAALVSANAAMQVMNIVFIVIYLVV